MDAPQAQVVEEADHVADMVFQDRLGLAGRQELATEIAAHHLEALGEHRGDRLPGGDGHEAAVQKQDGLTLAINAVVMTPHPLPLSHPLPSSGRGGTLPEGWCRTVQTSRVRPPLPVGWEGMGEGDRGLGVISVPPDISPWSSPLTTLPYGVRGRLSTKRISRGIFLYLASWPVKKAARSSAVGLSFPTVPPIVTMGTRNAPSPPA